MFSDTLRMVSRPAGQVRASPWTFPVPVLRCRRAIVIGIHFVLFVLAYALAYAIRFDGAIPTQYMGLLGDTLALLVLVRMGCFAMYRLYNGWWRHAGLHEMVELIKAVSVSSVCFLGILLLVDHPAGLPRAILILDWGITIVLLGGARLGARWLREAGGSKRAQGRARTLIVGAGSAGASLLRQIRADSSSALFPVGLVDDDPLKSTLRIHGVPVIGATAGLPRLVAESQATMVVVAIPSATREQMQRIADCCMGLSVEFKIVPSVRELVDGRARLDQLRTVQIEDLLGRPPINLNLEMIDADLAGRVVLITGGAGSIGSELARQVAMFGPAKLVLVEQAESPLYFVHLEISRVHPQLNVVPVIADITDAGRMEQVFAEHRPDAVFHTAAYKHVPMMEANLPEAVRNNVLGTFRVAEAAVRHRARKFLLISTDKAVHPSSVMGATKRIAERVVLGWPAFQRAETEFRAVRFGNVLGSDGSVVPLFKKQIAAGGPVTVTHPEVTRYFMTIPEAVQLVLQAASLPQSAQRISMLEMGEPVRIAELAENLIRLSGMEPYTEMPIVFSGLRPGEKLFEELMTEVETTVPTEIEKVRVVQSDEADGFAIQRGFNHIMSALAAGDSNDVLRAIYFLVPECVAPLRDRALAAMDDEADDEYLSSGAASLSAA